MVEKVEQIEIFDVVYKEKPYKVKLYSNFDYGEADFEVIPEYNGLVGPGVFDEVVEYVKKNI